jgi:anti-sigma28 factor (negative regulator of flagellin synthesis)
MPDSSQPKNNSTAIAKKADVSLNWGPDSEFQGKNATMLVQNSCLPSGIRLEKVLAIRQQLADGVYSIDQRLDTVLDKLLETLNT